MCGYFIVVRIIAFFFPGNDARANRIISDRTGVPIHKGDVAVDPEKHGRSARTTACHHPQHPGQDISIQIIGGHLDPFCFDKITFQSTFPVGFKDIIGRISPSLAAAAST